MKSTEQKQPGYYPRYSTLAQQKAWDNATQETVLDRVAHSTELRFFTSKDALLIEAIFEHILPQGDRDAKHRIPIVPIVDERLYMNRLNGYRYEDMPTDQEAYRLGMSAIEEMAHARGAQSFISLRPLEQDLLLQSIHDGKPKGATEIWEKLPVHRFWALLIHDAVEAYYAHPWAWDEIGFGGPAYPRAYMRLERGEAEPWEVEEQRYEWRAPEDSVSDLEEWIDRHNP